MYHLWFTCIWLKMQITLYSWYIMKYRHVRRPPLRLDQTAGMEATRRGRAYTAMLILGNKHMRCSYKSEAKRGKRGYFSFVGTATLSEATKQAVVAGRTCGCHIGTTKRDAASGHEMATLISSFSEWLLRVIVFTNIAIDIVTLIQTGIGAVIAIDIDTFIKRPVDKVKCSMVNTVCGMWLIH